jgi:WD40 repeat protein
MADELDRFLNDEPIHARPLTRLERGWRWCRRNPIVASLSSASLLLLLIVAIGGPVAAIRINRERQQAELRAYTADMNVVQQAWDEGKLARAQALLRAYIPKPGQRDLRGFEWRYLWKLCTDESRLSFTNFPSVVLMVLSPDGRFAAAASRHQIKLLDYANGRELGTLTVPNATDNISALAFSPAETNILVTASGKQVYLWDLAARRVAGRISVLNSAVALAISRDGKLLAVAGGQEQTMELWRIENNSLVWARNTPSPPLALLFSPDGRSLVSGGGELSCPLLWNLATGASSSFPAEREGWINTMALSPNGKLLVTGSADGTVILWDFTERELLARLIPPTGGSIVAAAFSPDGRWLVAGYGDSTLRVWDISTYQPKAIYRGHRYGITSVAFSPDGRTIVSSSEDRTVKVWDLAPRSRDEVLATGNSWVTTTTFSPDGKRLASLGLEEGVLTVWDVATRSRLADLTKPSFTIAPNAIFSPDGEILAETADERIKLWDARTFVSRGELTNGFDAISLSFAPNSRTLAAAGPALFHLHGITNRLVFWDVPSMKKINKLAAAAPLAVIVRFSHDGRTVAIGYLNGEVRLWDYKTERLLAEFTDQHNRIWAVEFSPDDGWLVAGGFDGAVVFYDVHSRRAFRPVTETSDWILGLSFTPDGRTLASAEGDGTVKFWNVATREVALTLRGHVGQCTAACFSPGGNLLSSCGSDATVRLWPAAALNEIQQPQAMQ